MGLDNVHLIDLNCLLLKKVNIDTDKKFFQIFLKAITMTLIC